MYLILSLFFCLLIPLFLFVLLSSWGSQAVEAAMESRDSGAALAVLRETLADMQHHQENPAIASAAQALLDATAEGPNGVSAQAATSAFQHMLAVLRSRQQQLLQCTQQQRDGSEAEGVPIGGPSVGGVSAEAAMDAAAAAAARAHRLEEAVADAESAYRKAGMDIKKQQQQIEHAEIIMEQQTSASVLQQKADAVQSQLSLWVSLRVHRRSSADPPLLAGLNTPRVSPLVSVC